MISLKKRLAAAVPTPAADKVTVFIDETGAPKTKDEAGVVDDLVAGGGGTDILQQTAAPSSPATGDLWIDTDATGTQSGTSVPVYIWNGVSDYAIGTGRIFIGPNDPATEGFTLADGDIWEQTP